MCRAQQKRTYKYAPKAHLQVRTKSAPTDAHQERTYRCAPKAHLQVACRCAPKAHLPFIYIFAPAPVKSTPTGVHQKRTYRCAPKAHLQVRTKSAPACAHQMRTYRCAPTGAHLQVRTYPSFTYLHPHQKRTYHYINVWTIQMTAHQTCTYMSAPTVQVRNAPKAHLSTARELCKLVHFPAWFSCLISDYFPA